MSVDSKDLAMDDVFKKREELVNTNKVLGEKFTNLQQELVNTEKQIHMVNGALNVLDLLINDNKDEE